MLRWLGATLLSRIFGDGLAADVAARGVVYLADNARDALRHDEEPVTRVRLTPGETYTVIARPPASRRERKLAARVADLEERDRRASVPTRRQLRSARRLARTQRRLDRARDGSRRQRRLRVTEERRGERFDRLTAPSRRQRRVHQELAAARAELERLRGASFERARSGRAARSRRSRTRVYD